MKEMRNVLDFQIEVLQLIKVYTNKCLNTITSFIYGKKKIFVNNKFTLLFSQFILVHLKYR